MKDMTEQKILIPRIYEDPRESALEIMCAAEASRGITNLERNAALFYLIDTLLENREKELLTLSYILTNRGLVSSYDRPELSKATVRIIPEISPLLYSLSNSMKRKACDKADGLLAELFADYVNDQSLSTFVNKIYGAYFEDGIFGPKCIRLERIAAFDTTLNDTRFPLIIGNDFERSFIKDDSDWEILTDLVPEARYTILAAQQDPRTKQRSQTSAFQRQILDVVRISTEEVLAPSSDNNLCSESLELNEWQKNFKERLVKRLNYVIQDKSHIKNLLRNGSLEDAAIARMTRICNS